MFLDLMSKLNNIFRVGKYGKVVILNVFLVIEYFYLVGNLFRILKV